MFISAYRGDLRLQEKQQCSNGYNVQRDPMLPLGTFFATLYLIYFFNQTFASEIPIAVTFWAVALALGLVIIKPPSLVLPFLVSLLAGLAYVLGYAFQTSSNVSLQYFPQILTMFVGSAWVLSILRNTNRIEAPAQLHKWIHRAFALGTILWTFISIRQIAITKILEVREVTGYSYLTTSDLMTMFGIASLSRREISGIEFLIIFYSCLFTVTFLGSRSAMILFSVIAIFIFLRRFPIRTKLGILVVGTPIMVYAALKYVDFESPAFQRLSTIFNILADSSLDYRIAQVSNFSDNLVNKPVCFFISCHTPEGLYTHNFISIIEHFGFLGVSVFSLIVLTSLSKWRIVIQSNLIALFVFSFTSITFTRAWVSPVFPVFLAINLFFLLTRAKNPSLSSARGQRRVARST